MTDTAKIRALLLELLEAWSRMHGDFDNIGSIEADYRARIDALVPDGSYVLINCPIHGQREVSLKNNPLGWCDKCWFAILSQDDEPPHNASDAPPVDPAG